MSRIWSIGVVVLSKGLSSMKKFEFAKLILVLVIGLNSLPLHANIIEAEKALKELLSDVKTMEGEITRSVKEEQPTHYKTKYGDTLDDIIINHVVEMPVKRNIIKRAIVNANPNAFKSNNPNWMYSGRTIKLPDANDIKTLIFTDEALDKLSLGRNRDEWIRFP